VRASFNLFLPEFLNGKLLVGQIFNLKAALTSCEVRVNFLKKISAGHRNNGIWNVHDCKITRV
jgi:hypothetical protein